MQALSSPFTHTTLSGQRVMKTAAVSILFLLAQAKAVVRQPPFERYALEDSAYGAPDVGTPPPPPPLQGAAAAPYPPSGWAPSGDLLLLPGETHSSQQNGYGPPPPPPPPPPNQYGTPATTQSSITSTTTEATPNEGPPEETGQIKNGDFDNGQYYVLLTNGKLQKVQYSGKQKSRGQYEAQVEYEEVEPEQAPLPAYSFQSGIPF